MGEGARGLDGIPMEGMFVEINRVGWGSDTWKKVCILSILKFACAFVQANQSFSFYLSEYPVKVDSDKIVQCKSTHPNWHVVPK